MKLQTSSIFTRDDVHSIICIKVNDIEYPTTTTLELIKMLSNLEKYYRNKNSESYCYEQYGKLFQFWVKLEGFENIGWIPVSHITFGPVKMSSTGFGHLILKNHETYPVTYENHYRKGKAFSHFVSLCFNYLYHKKR